MQPFSSAMDQWVSQLPTKLRLQDLSDEMDPKKLVVNKEVFPPPPLTPLPLSLPTSLFLSLTLFDSPRYEYRALTAAPAPGNRGGG